MLDDLADDERGALEAIRDAPVGWSWIKPPTGEAAEAWRAELRADRIRAEAGDEWLRGLNGEAAAIPALEAEGLVERWRLPDGSEAVCLTPRAAEALDVELGAFGPAENLPRWVNPGDMPRFARQPRGAHCSPLDLPELIADEAPGPLEVATWEWNGTPAEPVLLFGREIPVDRRLGRGEAAPARKAARPKRRRSSKGRRGRAGAS